jgi:hypothetical protein
LEQLFLDAIEKFKENTEANGKVWSENESHKMLIEHFRDHEDHFVLVALFEKSEPVKQIDSAYYYLDNSGWHDVNDILLTQFQDCMNALTHVVIEKMSK